MTCRVCAASWWIARSSRSASPARNGGCSPFCRAALAADLDLTKVAIGGLLDRMEAAGFVERRADASDGRARRVYLTRAGSRMVNTIRENVEQIELQILENVSEESLNQAASILLVIKETLLELAGSDGETIGADPEFLT